jgi:hypothetical protein
MSVEDAPAGGPTMRRVLLILLFIGVWSSDLGAEDATARYEALVKIAKQGDQPVDWQALRFAYAETPNFDPLGAVTSSKRKKMFAAYAARDYATALAEAQHILEENYTDIAAHMISDYAYHYLGDDTRARQQGDIAITLLKSIRTGDGHSTATALTVISITEEYDFLHYLKYEPRQQTLVTEGGHSYDMFEVERDQQSYSLYFLADRVLAAEAALFKPKP